MDQKAHIRALARAHDRDHLATLMLAEIRTAADIRIPEKRRVRQRFRLRQRKAAMAREEFPQAGNF